MSEIERLIQRYCTDGVEYKALRDITVKAKSIKWKDEEGERQYIDLASVDIESHKIQETSTVDRDNAPSRARQIVNSMDVLFATTRPTQMRYCIIPDEYDQQICSTGYCVLRAKSEIVDPRFLCHAIGASTFFAYVGANQTQGNYPAVSDTVVKAYRIPVPPAEVQQAIVEILDSFVGLENELRAELDVRMKQYRHYSEKLLSSVGEENALSVDELGDVVRGKVISKQYLRDHAGEYPVYSSQTENDGVFGCIDTYAFDGDYLTWTTDGANAGTVFRRTGKFSITNVCGLIKAHDEIINLDYFYYALARVAKKYVSEGMGNPKLMSNVMKSIRIAVPSFEIQNSIVAELDGFNAFIKSLQDEIAVRHAQYEHYRDELLSFPRKGE